MNAIMIVMMILSTLENRRDMKIPFVEVQAGVCV